MQKKLNVTYGPVCDFTIKDDDGNVILKWNDLVKTTRKHTAWIVGIHHYEKHPKRIKIWEDYGTHYVSRDVSLEEITSILYRPN